ncbi:hypothetical protein [Anaeromyxobacter terrae]|uniref:hypothetical protein n=1 Tax=Anaeromyxobacter terrae TaxID=2925406 RepID=UPI001F58FA9B|nr:hypothetical protein [Anaeromyxobacter sp. SG22]
MTKRKAALRGSLAAMMWATILTAITTLILHVSGTNESVLPTGIRAGAKLLSPRFAEILMWAVLVLPVSGMAGGLVGILGDKLRARPFVRAILLWLTFFAALSVITGPWLTLVGSVYEVTHGSPSLFPPSDSGLDVALKALFIGWVGTVALAPVLAIPVLFAAITVERWTRATAGARTPGTP